MSYNPNLAGAPELMAPEIQDWLETTLVMKSIGAPVTYEGILKKGKSIDVPYLPDGLVVDYNQGTDMNFTAYQAIEDKMLIDISRAANFTLGKNELKQLADKNYRAKLTMRHAFRLAADTDQKGLKIGVDNAGSTYALGTPTAGNIFQKFADIEAQLSRGDAHGTRFIVIPPEHVSLLAQSELANGFNSADSALKNGFVGPSSTGFKVYKSNNLPVSVVYTMDTINTAGATFTIAGYTFTFVAAGAATLPGDIAIGANVAANQQNWLDAINGTGTPGAATYIEPTVFNRRKLTNAGVSAAAFSANASVITGFGRMKASTTSTDGGNAVGNETGSILAGDIGVLRYAIQRMPEIDMVPLQYRPAEFNISISTLWGGHIFELDKSRVINGTFTFA